MHMHAPSDPFYREITNRLSIEHLNPMQEELIAKSAPGKNIILLSPTGSGKTLAFLLAVLRRLDPESRSVQALIIAPARELALQIEHVFKTMKTGYKVSCVYGGHSARTEENALSEAPAVIIGTPGRISDHINRKSFDPGKIKIVVLDEFDKSLQMGYHEPLAIVFRALRGKQDHILTSATGIRQLPDFIPFKDAITLNYVKEERSDKLQLRLVKTPKGEKAETLLRLVAGFNQEACLIFCNHREAVERISELFSKNKFDHGVFQGAMEQVDREKNLIRFRSGACNVLISTDLAARGLDIPEIRHVVHYQLPPKEDAFIHRNGRTARMHADGVAYLIQSDDEALPEYIDRNVQEFSPNEKLKLPPMPKYACVYVSAGKKQKISKGDIAGFFMKAGGLKMDEIGLISILDHSSYVAVDRQKMKLVLQRIQNEKLKKLKVKIEEAN